MSQQLIVLPGGEMFSKVGQRPQHARCSRRKVVRYVAHLLLVVLFVAGFALSLLPWGRAFARASLLLPALVSGTESPLLVNGGEEVRHRQMTVPSQSGPVFLDIYEPAAAPPLISSARSGVLVIPGVGDNRQFPPLVNLLQALARTGLIVMNITTPTLINYDLSAQDSDAVVQAFQALAHLLGMQDHRIGLIAFSGGAILASLGAADARIRDRLAYVAISGGYFNTRSVLRAFGRRAIDIDGHTERWQPIDVPILVMTKKAMLLSLFWILAGAVIGLLASVAWPESPASVPGNRRRLYLAGIGALAGLGGGWLGVLLLGKYFATAMMLWMTVVIVVQVQIAGGKRNR
ncbi:MAG: hypothetical protein IMW89_08420 [Ktedonobacteraceae bacterium]|nr:hypothetical protein [Ktedonobacteraceae bacterium]